MNALAFDSLGIRFPFAMAALMFFSQGCCNLARLDQADWVHWMPSSYVQQLLLCWQSLSGYESICPRRMLEDYTNLSGWHCFCRSVLDWKKCEAKYGNPWSASQVEIFVDTYWFHRHAVLCCFLAADSIIPDIQKMLEEWRTDKLLISRTAPR